MYAAKMSPTATVLLLPGYNGSGPEHWQTLWQAQRPDSRRVEQPCWDNPDPDTWCRTLSPRPRSR